MIDIPKSPDLQSQQMQEMARSVPDPFPLFGGGVWARDYKLEALNAVGGAEHAYFLYTSYCGWS